VLSEVLDMATETVIRNHTWQPTGLVIENEISVAEEMCTECGASRMGAFSASAPVPNQCHGSRERFQEWQRNKLNRQNRCEVLIRANSTWVWLDEAKHVRGLIPKKGFERRVALLQAIANSPY
jgi:hypothetical protein